MTTTGPWQGPVQIRDVQDSDLEQLFEHQLDPEATRMAAFPARDRDAFMAHWADPGGPDRGGSDGRWRRASWSATS